MEEFYTWGIVFKDEVIFIFSKNRNYLYDFLKENAKEGDIYIEFHKKTTPRLDLETFESVIYRIPLEKLKEAIEMMEEE